MQLNTHQTRISHRKPAVCIATGWSNSTLYSKIKQGLFVKPVKMGPMTSIWPDDEVSKLQAAYIAGKSDEEIRTLVTELHAFRKVAA